MDGFASPGAAGKGVLSRASVGSRIGGAAGRAPWRASRSPRQWKPRGDRAVAKGIQRAAAAQLAGLQKSRPLSLSNSPLYPPRDGAPDAAACAPAVIGTMVTFSQRVDQRMGAGHSAYDVSRRIGLLLRGAMFV